MRHNNARLYNQFYSQSMIARSCTVHKCIIFNSVQIHICVMLCKVNKNEIQKTQTMHDIYMNCENRLTFMPEKYKS